MEIQKRILDTIAAFERIVICRHKRPDGDAYGSTYGLREILRTAFPSKDIRLLNDDYSEYLSFFGPEDEPFTDAEFASALFIVLDCGTSDRISQSRIKSASFVIKIDHHIDNKPYGDLSWVEDERSSACEMVAALCLHFPDILHLNKTSATYLYTGLVTDTGRFRHDGTDGDTLRIGAALIDQGICLEQIYAHLYMKPFEELLFSAQMTRRIRRTPNGVAYLHVTSAVMQKYGMSTEQASELISRMEKIKGSLIYVAFIDYPDGTIRVRLRSRFLPVQKIATHYRGGGHANACGGTLVSRSEIKKLLEEADELLREYKANNEGWL